MQLSRHAQQRWQQRFPTLDPDTEWASARRVGKRLRRRIGHSCTGHKRYTLGQYRGYCYLLSKGGVIFVVAPPEHVVTVLRSANL